MSTSRFEQLVERTFEVGNRSGEEWTLRCPQHEDRTPSLRLNITKRVFVCFSCGWKGNARILFGEIVEPDPEISDVLAILDASENPPPGQRILSEAVLRRYTVPTDYWASRGFSGDTVDAWDLGYDPLEDDAIIPVRTLHGDLTGVIRRRLNREDGPKYLYQRGFSKSTNLFGSWMVDDDTVAITEGPLDAVSVWQAGIPAVAQYGSNLSTGQVQVLHRMGINKVVLFHDHDRAGQRAMDQATEALSSDFLVYRVAYSVTDPKDPGSTSSERIRELVQESTMVLLEP